MHAANSPLTPQDDLTAERAATDMYNRLFSVMRSPEHEHHAKARLKLFYQVTRQAALREACVAVSQFSSDGRPIDAQELRIALVQLLGEMAK